MKFLTIIAIATAAVHGAPSHNLVTPVILPKVHVTSPDVTVVRQPYLIQQTEPVFRHVFYADPVAFAAPYAAYHHGDQQHAGAVFESPSYAPAVNYIV